MRLCLRVFYFPWKGYQPVCKTPFLEDQLVSLSLVSLLRPARLGRPYQEHIVPASMAHKVTEAPPRQGGDMPMPEQVKRPNPWRKMMMTNQICDWKSRMHIITHIPMLQFLVQKLWPNTYTILEHHCPDLPQFFDFFYSS